MPNPPASTRPGFCIVDDNAASLAILARMIRSIGGIAETSSSASEAVAAIQAAQALGNRFSVLMVDSKMPNVDGVELLKSIRDRNDQTPAILMLTSDELHARFDRMKEAGLCHYLVKPAKRAELSRILMEAMAGEAEQSKIARTDAVKTNGKPVSAQTKAARILLAEDNPGNRMLVKAFLKATNYEIDEAENGALAVNKFTSGKYDVVLMDMYMPVVDGYEATAAIRKWEREGNLERTPVVALTAAAMAGDRERSLDAGCDFHVTKPVSKAVLLELLDSLVRGRTDQAHSSAPYDIAAELDDPALFAEVAELFLKEMDRLIVTIDAAFAASDFKKLKDYVHSLKGSAAMVGANPMAAICKEIEANIAERLVGWSESTASRNCMRNSRAHTRYSARNPMSSRRPHKETQLTAVHSRIWMKEGQRGFYGSSSRDQNFNRGRFHADPQDVARAPGDFGLYHRG